jgi:hypothetical protein
MAGAGATVDEGAGIRGVLENSEEHAVGRRPPNHLAELVEAGQGEAPVPEATEHLAD